MHLISSSLHRSDYVNIAVRLSKDSGFLHYVRDVIKQRSHLLWEVCHVLQFINEYI